MDAPRSASVKAEAFCCPQRWKEDGARDDSDGHFDHREIPVAQVDPRSSDLGAIIGGIPRHPQGRPLRSGRKPFHPPSHAGGMRRGHGA